MGYFPEGSPQQELNECVEYLMEQFALSSGEIVIVLLEVTSAFADPFCVSADNLKNKRIKS